MQTPKEIVDGLVAAAREKGNTFAQLEVPTEFYQELHRACLPKTPEEYYGFPILVNPALDDEFVPTVETLQ